MIFIAVWPFCEMAECGFCVSRPSALVWLRERRRGLGAVLHASRLGIVTPSPFPFRIAPAPARLVAPPSLLLCVPPLGFRQGDFLLT